MRSSCRSPTAHSTVSSLPRSSSTCPRTARRSPSSSAFSNTVARWPSERLCWALSDEYHANEGGHIRIYRADQLRGKVAAHGLRFTHTHHAHALHSPFWWLKCLVGTANSDHPAVKAYHQLLV